MRRWAGVALIAAATMAGCGGGSDDPPAAVGGGGGAAGDSDRAVRYSECMRANGVPDFPDPQNGRLTLRAGPGGVDPDSAAFQRAQETCRELAPTGPPAGSAGADEMQERALEHARCMRANGVPDFPDPQVDGGRVQMQLPRGLDPESPALRRAQQACQGVLGGAP